MWFSCKQFFNTWDREKKNDVFNIHIIPQRNHMINARTLFSIFTPNTERLTVQSLRWIDTPCSSEKKSPRKFVKTHVFVHLLIWSRLVFTRWNWRTLLNIQHTNTKKHKQIMISTSHQLYAVYALAPNASFLLINSNFIETFHRHLFFPKKMKHFFVIT